jgi:HD superfamily phosphohydrolase YqeK
LRYGINNDELLKTIWEHTRKKQKRREGERSDFVNVAL